METRKGYCKCGCGQKARIATKTRSNWGHIKGEPLDYIHGHNGVNQRGPNHSQWKGGVSIVSKEGYSYIHMYCPGHPRASANNRVLAHILIAEKALGKYLPLKSVVHHHDAMQLVVCEDENYHRLIHKRMRAYKACGNPNWLKCEFCEEWDNPTKLVIRGYNYHHRECFNEHRRRVYNGITGSEGLL